MTGRSICEDERLDSLLGIDTEWSDYGGDWIYADWKMIAIGDGDKAADGGDGKLPGTFNREVIAGPGNGSGGEEDPTEDSTVRQYLTGVAHADVSTDGAWDDTAYYHGNQISSTRLLTNDAGTVVRDLGYTAFGEEVDLGGEIGTRYRYAGEWGYESHDEFSFLHVGHRWYDPETGRFLQRDRIGIHASLNCYAYVTLNPTGAVDPRGLDRWIVGSAHWAIVVGGDKTGYTKIELGPAVSTDAPAEGLFNMFLCATTGGLGGITVTSCKRPKGHPELYTSKAQDDALREKFKDGDYHYYNLWFHNCQHFANKYFDYGTPGHKR